MNMKKIVSILICILAVGVLAGCRISVKDRGDNGVTVDVGNIHVGPVSTEDSCKTGVNVETGDTKVEVGLGGVNVTTDSGDYTVNFGSFSYSGKKDCTMKYDKRSLSSEINTIEAKLDMGNLKIRKSDDSEASYEWKVKVSGKNEDICRELASKLYILAEEKDGKMSVSAKVKDSTEAVSKFLAKNYDGYNADFTVTVYATDALSEINAEISMGNVDVDDICAKYLVDINMGNFEGNSIAFSDGSEILVDMGNVEAKLCDSQAKADIKLAVDMGNIDLRLKGSDEPSFSAKAFSSMGFDGTVTYSKSGLCINAKVDMGNADFS